VLKPHPLKNLEKLREKLDSFIDSSEENEKGTSPSAIHRQFRPPLELCWYGVFGRKTMERRGFIDTDDEPVALASAASALMLSYRVLLSR